MKQPLALGVCLLCRFGFAMAAAESSSDEVKGSHAVAALIGELRAGNESNRIHAAKSLVKIGPSVSEAVMGAVGLSYADKTASAALNAFVKLGSEAVPMMLALMRAEKSWELRHNPGLNGILQMGTNALPGLEQSLTAPEWEVRGAVIDALRLLQGDPASTAGCAKLLFHEAESDPDEKLRVYAVDALGYSRTFGRDSVPPTLCEGLRNLLKDKNAKIRITAAYSLAKSCRDSTPEVLAALVEGLGQSDARLAEECAFAMEFLGTNAAPALPDLAKALEREGGMLSSEAGKVLAGIGDPAFPALASAAASTNIVARVSGLSALADLNVGSTNNLERSLDILSKALRDPDKDTRQTAANSLRRIGVERRDPVLAKRISKFISPLVTDPDRWVRDDAERALKELTRISLPGSER